MYIVERSIRFLRGFLASYAPSRIKKSYWDHEFSSGNWDFLDNTAGDCVYQHLERHAKKGSILDLGCGPGNTANELDASAYGIYVGLDISDAALDKARRRSQANGRSDKNIFAQGDFLKYLPSQRFDVILLRESLYHVPIRKIKKVLDRYSKYLTDDGVFIVRLYTVDHGKTKGRPTQMLRIIEREFNVVESAQYSERGATVIVFRPARKFAEAACASAVKNHFEKASLV